MDHRAYKRLDYNLDSYRNLQYKLTSYKILYFSNQLLKIQNLLCCM